MARSKDLTEAPTYSCLGLEAEDSATYRVVEVKMLGSKVVEVIKSEPTSLPLALYNLKMRGANTWLLKR